MMAVDDKLHAKRATTEEHVRELEAAGNAGERYTVTMPDRKFAVLGIICDIGWLAQIIIGGWLLNDHTGWLFENQVYAPMAFDLLLISVAVLYTIYLDRVHEKEIALRWQKNLSFGLMALAGILGIVAGIVAGSFGFTIGAVLNAAGAIPIYASFKKGIIYGIQ